MKKSFKTGVCKALTTIACATFMFAGALGLGSITAKAASRVYPIDLSNGRTTGVNENELTDEYIIPQGVKDFYMLMTVMELYMDESNLEKGTANSAAKIIMSRNPYQAITFDRTESALKIKAVNGSKGIARYVINKNVVEQFYKKQNYSYSISEEEYKKSIKRLEEVVDGKPGTGDTEFIIEIKFSDLPLVVENVVSGTPVISFITGSEFENGGINYRITDRLGNLCAISLSDASKNVTIPDSVNYDGYNLAVTTVADRFMKGNKKTKNVTIGANVTSIGKEAFYKCKKLKKVTVKSTKIASFGKKAFGKDAKNFKLKMPKSCKKAYKKLLKKAKIKF